MKFKSFDSPPTISEPDKRVSAAEAKEIYLQLLHKKLAEMVSAGEISQQQMDRKFMQLGVDLPPEQLFTQEEIENSGGIDKVTITKADLELAAEIVASTNEVVSDDKNPEKIALNLDKYMAIAQELEEKYVDSLGRDLSAEGGKDIPEILKQFPSEVLGKYLAHGSHGYDGKSLEALVPIIGSRVLIGDWCTLKNDEYRSGVYTADFLVLSRRDKPIDQSGKNMISIKIEGVNSYIGADPLINPNQLNGSYRGSRLADDVVFVCGIKLDPVADELRALFPEAVILKSSELAYYLKSEEEKARQVEKIGTSVN